MTDLIQLAERCEKAGADEQWELLTASFAEFFPEPDKTRVDLGHGIMGMSEQWVAWDQFRDRFETMLYAEAYETAALMLLPEGCAWSVTTDFELLSQIPDRGWTADASTTALAIAAAALKARAGETQNGGA